MDGGPSAQLEMGFTPTSSKPTRRLRSSSSSKPALPPGYSFEDLISAASAVHEERADALNLLQTATLLELVAKNRTKAQEARIRKALLKWMAESDITVARFETTLKS